MEDWSYLVTVIAAPLALVVWIRDQIRERRNEDEEIHQQLSDSYADFLKLVLAHADLRLRSTHKTMPMTDDQRERKLILFDILISLFERAYILVYEDDMDHQAMRMWRSWEDYMREWCKRADFRAVLPQLLEGEDPDFAAHIMRISEEVAANPHHEESTARLLR